MGVLIKRSGRWARTSRDDWEGAANPGEKPKEWVALESK